METKNNYPLVSICIPTYNGAGFLQEALKSTASQTYPNLEIIVSDDNSTDNTWHILEAFKNSTKTPLRLFKHEPQGIGANWNHCIKQAKGDFIKFLFQDDVLEPSCIQEMMSLMLSGENIGMVYCKRYFLVEEQTSKTEAFIKEYGNLTAYWESVKVKQGVMEGKHYLKDLQLLNAPKNKIGEPTAVLLRKTVFDSLGYFDEVLQQTLDCEYWYRIMTLFDVGFLDKELVGFRLHLAQASSVNKTREIPDKILLYKRYYKFLWPFLHPKNKWKLLKLFHPLIKPLVSFKQLFYAR